MENKRAINSSASETLCLYGLLRHWVEVRLRSDDRIKGERYCFMLVCKQIDMLLAAKHNALPLAEVGHKLLDALGIYMGERKRVHARSGRPKGHWAIDVAQMMLEDEWLFDAFVVERLHLRVKEVASHVKGHRRFERAVLSGVVNVHAESLRDKDFMKYAAGPTAHCPGLPDVQLTDRLRGIGLPVAVRDCVFLGGALGVVLACCVDSVDAYVIVNELHKVADLSAHSSTWSQRAAERKVWPARQLSECIAWQTLASGDIVALRM
jgi:hypothetical protein